MTTRRISLKSLTVTNSTLPAAELSFRPGLNLIIGASDTGKTYVFEIIDFMMGAKEGLRAIPESTGYERVTMTVEPSIGAVFSLRRAIGGGDFQLIEFGNGLDQIATATRNLSPTHSADPQHSLSAYLLDLIGIGNRQIRKDAQGGKKALSFRHVAHLTLINEERIIQQSSPIHTPNAFTERTAEANAFSYFITGQDDSAIIPQESSKERRARMATEAGLLETLLAERNGELKKLIGDANGLSERAARLEASIESATNTVVASQSQISELERRRDEFTKERIALESRTMFLGEQLKRLRLLGEYYNTDRARLEAVIEAAHVIHDLPEGTCPLCKQPLSSGEASHIEFETACQREVEKIAQLQQGLSEAITDFELEAASIQSRVQMLNKSLRDIDRDLLAVLVPASKTTQAELQELIKTRTVVAQAATLQTTIVALQERLDAVQLALAQRHARPVFENRATTSSTTEFCDVVEEILRAWKYPDLSEVSFDTAKGDLVIAGQDRANKGKGYRALTFAAFTVGLMKYCRLKSIPHPGIVVLDTPVNPFKGPSPTTPSEYVPDVVREAFFEYLAADSSGDQIIVMENVEPPAAVRERVHCVEFTRNRNSGRFGFFPPRPEQEAKTSSKM